MEHFLGTSSYSPDDNKLRLYPFHRLDEATYRRVKAAGFIWAPKQDLFVAPMWTPDREDLLLELCGEIDDEDKSLVERAEERAERFDDYSDKREEDANRAHAAVHAIADNIPLGQPILVGHHSERHARKDQERIENNMRKAVKMWDTAQYWKRRAAGAISNAKYKERPDVRHRRIKGLEADKRKQGKNKARAEFCLKFWRGELKKKAGGFLEVTRESALWFCNHYEHVYRKYPLAEYPRQLPASQYEGEMGLWTALGGSDGPEHMVCTVDQAKELAMRAKLRIIENANRWITHLDNRLEYERAMLGEAGGVASDKFDIEVGGRVLVRNEWLVVLRVNRIGGIIRSVTTNARYVRKKGVEEISDYRAPTKEDTANVETAIKILPLCNYPGAGIREMTQADWKKKPTDYKGTRVQQATEKAGAHRLRYSMFPNCQYDPVYLTDAKRTDPPKPTPPKKPIVFEREVVAPAVVPAVPRVAPEPTVFHALKEQLKAGVKVVTAPQLFPTPAAIVERMIYRAKLHKYPALRILEPSAGTGAILKGLLPWTTADKVAVEIHPELVKALVRQGHSGLRVHCADFLECNGDLGTFDRIIMNPPFVNGSDIKHIEHALSMLKPGGCLVAICANGSRQNEKLKPLAATWEELPPDTFKEQGTGVRTVLLTINKD